MGKKAIAQNTGGENEERIDWNLVSKKNGGVESGIHPKRKDLELDLGTYEHQLKLLEKKAKKGLTTYELEYQKFLTEGLAKKREQLAELKRELPSAESRT